MTKEWRFACLAAMVLGALGVLTLLFPDRSRAATPLLTTSLRCDRTLVVVGSDFDCSVVFRNTGDVTFTGVAAQAGFELCLQSGSCCVCIIGLFPLEYVSADPAWTGYTLQYHNPLWDPLGSGTLAPGESASLTVTVRAALLHAPGSAEGSRPAVCLFGSGYANTDGLPSAEQTLSSDCVTIDVVEALPVDVNCDERLDSVDALLLLQLIAGLIPSLPCPDGADTNGDGVVDPIDAELILQFSAGLIHQFS